MSTLDVTAARPPAHRRGPRSGPSPVTTAARVLAATTWVHQGAWAKLADRQPWQTEVIARLPGVGPRRARRAACLLGAGEVVLGAWTLTGRAPRTNAATQVAALTGVKLTGRALTGRWQPDARHAAVTAGLGLLCAAVGATAARLPPDHGPRPRRHDTVEEVAR